MNRRLWTAQELAIVRELYPHRPTVEIARLLGNGRTTQKVYAAATKLGLHKSAEYAAALDVITGAGLAKSGAPFRFAKGHPPANKGLRRPGYGPGRMKETQFKKGQFPANRDPEFYVLGALRVNADGYIDMRVSFDHGALGWKALHRILWEDENGPVPAGHKLCFRDRDRLNVDLPNLELVSDAEVCRRNSIHKLPPQLKKTIYALGALNRRINREEQNRGLTKPPLRNNRRSARQGKADGSRSREDYRWRRPGNRRFRKSRERVHAAHG
jgi:hypothetical protein